MIRFLVDEDFNNDILRGLRRRLPDVFDKVPVSNLCDEYGIQPSMFYNWQKVLADNAARAFETEGRERGRPSREAELEQKIAQLEAKLAKKDGIIAEISEEYVTLKKELGEP